MEVILTMDVPEVGTRGDRVTVAAGFARNYLLPRGLALPATRGNQRIMAEEGRLTDVRDSKARREAGKVAEFLAQHEVFTTLKIGREGKAFGAVTAKDIAVLLKKVGLEVDRRRIQLDRPIKRLGVFDVSLGIHKDVPTLVKVFVDREGGSKEGAVTQQEAHEAELKALEEVAKAEAEERAAREAEAEEAARIALERAAARKIREEAEAAAREERRARESAALEEGDVAAPVVPVAEAAQATEAAPEKAGKAGKGEAAEKD